MSNSIPTVLLHEQNVFPLLLDHHVKKMNCGRFINGPAIDCNFFKKLLLLLPSVKIEDQDFTCLLGREKMLDSHSIHFIVLQKLTVQGILEKLRTKAVTRTCSTPNPSALQSAFFLLLETKLFFLCVFFLFWSIFRRRELATSIVCPSIPNYIQECTTLVQPATDRLNRLGKSNLELKFVKNAIFP